MTTPRTRAIVSLVVTMTTLVLGGCAHATPSSTPTERPSSLTIRFDNNATEFVRVYLITDQREWPLGRVEAGAVASLRIPEQSLGGTSRFYRLAVIAGGPTTLRAARDPRTTYAMAQAVSGLVSQQWRFAQGQVTPVRLQ